MKVLYKYYSDKFDVLDHLENPAIKLAPTLNFNDPFESTLCEALAIKLSEGLLDFAKTQGDTSLIDVYKNVYMDLPKNYGVISLTENHRNILMWAHYASSHKGICIGYKHDFIEKKFKANEIDHLLGTTNPLPQRVIYDSKRFDINKFNEKTPGEQIPYDFIMEKMLIKSNEWIYEKEHRCIMPFQYGELIKTTEEPSIKTEDLINENLNKMSIKKSNRKNEYYFHKLPNIQFNNSIHVLAQQNDVIILKEILPESIDSIYFGCQSDDSIIRETIKKLDHEHYNGVRVYKYKTNNDTFDINEERLL
ncbi:DUF2971 domain-containing protein [Aeromonas hydrophila]|uniref:DUF2971 domain-containing protein n=1 Tax=Aeromonas hydrophila TaxID=644 RepID=UPI001D0A2F0D|nr:DUF2971 domain-containing protein [Aeromonas hydrophila]MCC0184126.1 DUF2971 domain-containing protein [Aeromonas hydrophila]